MTNVFLLLKKDNSSTSISTWSSDVLAWKNACCYIQYEVSHNWNLKDPLVLVEAKVINDFVIATHYSSAGLYYNDCSTNIKSNNRITYELKYDIIQDSCVDPIMLDRSVWEYSVQPWRAKNPGAKCRKCGEENEFAHADEINGTYMCRQCKMFIDIFTGCVFEI
jgi:hypothetical protein